LVWPSIASSRIKLRSAIVAPFEGYENPSERT
jgi:hypothetical protein